jgi:hypothetical protein
MMFIVFKRFKSDPYQAFCGDGMSIDDIIRKACYCDYQGIDADTAENAINAAIDSGFTGESKSPDMPTSFPSDIKLGSTEATYVDIDMPTCDTSKINWLD